MYGQFHGAILNLTVIAAITTPNLIEKQTNKQSLFIYKHFRHLATTITLKTQLSTPQLKKLLSFENNVDTNFAILN